jgi:hypothetical protein
MSPSIRLNNDEDNKKSLEEESIVSTLGLRQRKNATKKASFETGWNIDEDDSDAEPPSVEGSTSGSFESDAESLESAVNASFFAFRLQYLIVHIAIMLADGMQGKFFFNGNSNIKLSQPQCLS